MRAKEHIYNVFLPNGKFLAQAFRAVFPGNRRYMVTAHHVPHDKVMGINRAIVLQNCDGDTINCSPSAFDALPGQDIAIMPMRPGRGLRLADSFVASDLLTLHISDYMPWIKGPIHLRPIRFRGQNIQLQDKKVFALADSSQILYTGSSKSVKTFPGMSGGPLLTRKELVIGVNCKEILTGKDKPEGYSFVGRGETLGSLL